MKNIYTRICDEHRKAIQSIANEQQVSFAAIVRQAIAFYLKHSTEGARCDKRES